MRRDGDGLRVVEQSLVGPAETSCEGRAIGLSATAISACRAMDEATRADRREDSAANSRQTAAVWRRARTVWQAEISPGGYMIRVG